MSISESVQPVADLLGGDRLVIETRAGQCDVHGEFIDRHMRTGGGLPSFWWGCPQCRAAQRDQEAQELQRKEMAAARAEAAARRAEATAQRLATSGIPRRFMAATWEGFRTSDTPGTGPGTQSFALKRCRAYADNFAQHLADGRCLLLLGNMGTGKNHLATCIARQVAEAGHSVVFTTAAQMLMAWRDVVVHKVPGNKGETALLREFASPHLLVLDELFRQSDTAASNRLLFDVLNARYAEALPTILISNKTLDEMRGVDEKGNPVAEPLLDPVLMDRLRERRAIAVPFLWASQRGAMDAPDSLNV